MEQSCSMHSNQQWVPRNIFYELDTTLLQSTLSFVFTKNYITLLTTKTLKLSSKITFTSILLSFFLLPSILCHPHIWCYRFSPSGSRNLIQIMAWAELTPEPSVFLWWLHHHLGNRDSLMMNTLQRGGQPTTNPLECSHYWWICQVFINILAGHKFIHSVHQHCLQRKLP